MYYLEAAFDRENALELEHFKKMDYYAVNQYHLPIELMMENAGLQLANLIAETTSKSKTIKIGVGNGNNGGGGLVAARRLSAWGYKIFIDAFTEITKELPLIQLKRALKFGAKITTIEHPDIWIDAYLGFSQRLPLDEVLVSRIQKANQSEALKIALDIPTGYLGDAENVYFEAHKIITLAAPKKILFDLPNETEVFVADIGIPQEVYGKFNVEMFPFDKNNIIKLKK